MAAEVSLGHIGIILCFEASRLSRNSKDWAQLFEVCGHLDTLVADLDQVYDLALPDDRLIRGVKGSVSEYELSLFRQRSQEAIVAKAKRGALTFRAHPGGQGHVAYPVIPTGCPPALLRSIVIRPLDDLGTALGTDNA